MKSAKRLRAIVSARGTVKVLDRVAMPAGGCEVLVLPCGAELSPKPQLKPLKPALERLAGFWADRKDITDSVEYAAELRRRLQTRRDRRG
ncbi:MAG: hypothetical protein HY303_13715 [Candidatus Wallbacteria bacterium]|nr:hypothetical protein [Candidatus Wallbacteria bacterium]